MTGARRPRMYVGINVGLAVIYRIVYSTQTNITSDALLTNSVPFFDIPDECNNTQDDIHTAIIYVSKPSESSLWVL